MDETTKQKIHYALRIAVAMCFIGHGAFGIITKPIWCNYFAVFGIGQHTALSLMPWVGVIDIFLGIMMIVYPFRAIPVWLVGWGLLTATLRPLAGEPFAELIERAGNFGAPFALLLLSGRVSRKNIFRPVSPDNHLSDQSFRGFTLSLQIIVFLLLAGHGWLNVIEKKSLVQQYSSLGFSYPKNTALAIGTLEIIAAFAVLIRPMRSLLSLLILWKIISEFFYPHYEMFEWIERGGSYGCLIALWLATGTNAYRNWLGRMALYKNFFSNTAS
ncbi:MAG TPA: hypothetical protein VKR53_17955 [Puia sp.]|nr:hypothetical protein [Puia sp.]